MYYYMTITSYHFETPNVPLPPGEKHFLINIQAISIETIDNPEKLLSITVDAVPEWLLRVGPIESDKEKRVDHWASELVMHLLAFELRDRHHAEWLTEKVKEEYMEYTIVE